jgi:hypothetical protein
MAREDASILLCSAGAGPYVRKSNSAARYFAGVKDHYRWLAQRHLLDASCKGGARPPSCSVDRSGVRPLAGLERHEAEALGVTLRAAQNLVAALALPETIGRSRYRVWGIF